MSERVPEPGPEFSEVDRVDQATPAFPDEVADGLPEASGPDGFVSEADWLEQQREAPLPDDDSEVGHGVA